MYVFAGANASFTLYDDEGINYNYEKGKFSEIELTYNDAARTLSIGDMKGSFAGMVSQRLFRVILISTKTPRAFDADIKPDREVTYSGKKIVVKL